MKKFITGFFLLIFISANAFSQNENKANDKADFNGTWVFDKEESSKPTGLKSYDNYFLVITFKEDKFKITKIFVVGKQAATYDITLSTDKSGETNTYTGLDGLVERTSKTYWQKNTLVSEFKLKPEKKKASFAGTETYSLSKDGKKLFFESIQAFPTVGLLNDSMFKTRLVFKRKEIKE